MQLSCIECAKKYAVESMRFQCECHGLLEVLHPDLRQFSTRFFDERRSSSLPIDRSGVWRFREAVLAVNTADIISHPEGGTHLYQRSELTRDFDVRALYIKHEGENPTGSFKDRGMTVAVTEAKRRDAKALACASTGNTSAALAAYGAQAGLKTLVFLPAGKVATGKIAQAVGYGATCLSVQGDFDAAMRLVRELSAHGVYLVNSLNPFRLEGQKTVMWESFQDLDWETPDWILVPGGNLGNTAAFGKAILEAYAAGWIKRMPRLATIQAAGASPFVESFISGFSRFKPVKAATIATAIAIGDPVNYPKARRVIQALNGVVTAVTDDEIMAAKRQIDRAGIGCEPASAASLAGLRRLRQEGTIAADASVLCVLTGHILKDADATMLGAAPMPSIAPTLAAVQPFL